MDKMDLKFEGGGLQVGVQQSTVIIIGVNLFNATSEQVTITYFCDFTTQLKTRWSYLCGVCGAEVRMCVDWVVLG